MRLKNEQYRLKKMLKHGKSIRIMYGWMKEISDIDIRRRTNLKNAHQQSLQTPQVSPFTLNEKL